MSWFKKANRSKLLSVTLVLATLAAGILIGTLINTGVKADRAQAPTTDAAPLVIPSPIELANEFTALVKKMEPAVVNISTTYETKEVAHQRGQGNEGDPDDDSLDRLKKFFGLPPNADVDPSPSPRGRSRGGTGSGFVVDPKGYIITNHHVVDEAGKIVVKLHGDSTEYRAKLIGIDAETDLAVIKIDAGHPLPYAKIGNSDGVQVGDWAVAIGSPFGLEASVTAGIVSAKGRDISDKQFQHFIQTDAAINPGNSGGPLLNIQGQVIGVNTMIATSSGGYQGIGFALPINTAVKVYNQLTSSGRVTRGSIGIMMPITANEKPELMKALGVEHGVFVDNVQKGGPAEKAGLRPNDIILAMDGKSVKDGEDLVGRVADTPIGQKLSLTVDRDGKKMELAVVVGDRTEVFKDRFQQTMTAPGTEIPSSPQEVKFGIKVRDLSPAQRDEMKIIEANQGIQITQVIESSFAADIGLQENDVVLTINRIPVSSVADIQKIQATLKPGSPVAFRVMRAQGSVRGGGRSYATTFITGTLPR